MNLSRSNGQVLLLLTACAFIAISASLLTARPQLTQNLIKIFANNSNQPVVIDINRASYPELLSINGIGPTLAERILSHRMFHGPFLSWEDLDQIRGIGPAIINKMRSMRGVCLSHECNLKAN